MEQTLTSYKNVTYKKFINELDKCYKESKKTEMELASCMKKTTMSVRNCFQPIKQCVSDKVLTHLLKCLGMKAKIEWLDGNRYYYVEDTEGLTK